MGGAEDTHRMLNSSPKENEPTPLHGAAADNLRYIRAAMESATAFTGVSGKGYVVGGITAAVAAWIAAQQPSATRWLAVWLLEAALAAGIMLLLTAGKARVEGKSLWTGSGRKLLFAFLPTFVAGALVTIALHLQGYTLLLPGLWLVLYGAGVITAGAHSIRLIPLMGILFMLAGAAQLSGFGPMNLTLALAFGGLHVIFGILIWRHHGG